MRKDRETKKPGIRVERVQSLIQEMLGTILPTYLQDLPGLVTVSRVEVASDMKHATVWLSCLGVEAGKVIKTLQANIYDLQGDINRKLVMKIIPKIQFMEDSSPTYAQHMSEILNDLDISPATEENIKQ